MRPTYVVLLVVGVGVAVYYIGRQQNSQPTTAQVLGGLAGRFASWWDQNYEFTFLDVNK